MEKLYTLKLDASWRPIEVIDAFKGANMVFGGRARVLESYDTGPHPTLKFPAVIVLKTYIHKRPFSLTCNRKMSFGEIKTPVNIVEVFFLLKI